MKLNLRMLAELENSGLSFCSNSAREIFVVKKGLFCFTSKSRVALSFPPFNIKFIRN